jgi:hypothetical protein
MSDYNFRIEKTFSNLLDYSKEMFYEKLNSAQLLIKLTYDDVAQKIEKKRDLEDFEKHFIESYEKLYRFNSTGHRCDEFKHHDNDILFAGCSETFGWTLPEEFTWSKLIYDKLKLKENSYFNIAVPSHSTELIVSNIFKFFNLYGNVKKIFVLFPNIERAVLVEGKKLDIRHYSPHNKKFADSQETYFLKNNVAAQMLSCVNSIKFLEQYCKEAKIDLMWGSWDTAANNFYKNINFKYFIDLELNSDYYYNYMTNLEKDWVLKNPSYKDIFVNAYDGSHRGAGIHHYIYEKFLEESKLRY